MTSKKANATPIENAASLTRQRIRKLAFSLSMQIVFPALVILACWGYSARLKLTSHAYEKSFITADPLLLVALICSTIGAELYCESRNLRGEDGETAVDVIYALSFIVAAFALLGYGMLKAYSLEVVFPAAGQSLASNIKDAVTISIYGGIAGVSWSVYAFWHSSYIIMKAELKHLQQRN